MGGLGEAEPITEPRSPVRAAPEAGPPRATPTRGSNRRAAGRHRRDRLAWPVPTRRSPATPRVRPLCSQRPSGSQLKIATLVSASRFNLCVYARWSVGRSAGLYLSTMSRCELTQPRVTREGSHTRLASSSNSGVASLANGWTMASAVISSHGHRVGMPRATTTSNVDSRRPRETCCRSSATRGAPNRLSKVTAGSSFTCGAQRMRHAACACADAGVAHAAAKSPTAAATGLMAGPPALPPVSSPSGGHPASR